MHRLDSVCGPENWKTEYVIHSEGVICKLSIRIAGEWVCKEDGAEQTEVEKFKGGLSSALKRAGSVWGIGRYLYDLESGFAVIVQKGTGGARYAKLPQDKGGDVFYWKAPGLPAWALPSDKPIEPPAPLPPIGGWTDPPGPQDAAPDDSYRVPFSIKIGDKDVKARTLEQIGPDDLRKAVDILDLRSKEKPLTPNQQFFVSQASAFLAAFENWNGDLL